MLRYLQKRYVRARLTAYIDGELNPASRRFVARLIDEHSDLYADYMTLRETRRNLERELPLIGRIDTHQMNNMWANINAQLQTEEALSAPPQSHRTPEPRFSFSYGMAVIIFVAALLLPLAFDTHTVSASIPAELPAPQLPATAATPTNAQTVDTQAVALSVQTEDRESTRDPQANLQNTPAPTTPAQS